MNEDIETAFDNEYNITGQVCFIKSNPIKSTICLIKKELKNVRETK